LRALQRCTSPGLRVALLERGRHPRFVIGESSTPLAGLLIEELADRYDLPRLRPLASGHAYAASREDVFHVQRAIRRDLHGWLKGHFGSGAEGRNVSAGSESKRGS